MDKWLLKRKGNDKNKKKLCNSKVIPISVSLSTVSGEDLTVSSRMPKTKKQASSSSDSDEGPVDRNVPASKKAKTDSRTDDAEPTWVLQGQKLVKIREFKGKTYVDIREFYEKNGKMLPGKKGISLTAEMWRKLISLSDEINDTLSKM